ncbi:MAG: hypothetical protein HYT75_01125 [Deltaproteobacteria bacterium]|nr:hypothetical protein [Deltaproteobacteria bacterium]
MKKFIIFCLLMLSCDLWSYERLFSVEFRDADIKSVLRLLAKMDDRNIVVPDKIEGKVTASFENIGLYDALDAVLKTHGYGVIEENNILQVLSKDEMQSLGEDLQQATFILQYAKASDILPQIQALITSRGSAVADERTNTIFVRDSNAAVNNIRGLVANIDKKDSQVLIEAKIIEASLDFIRSLGVQWGVTKSGGKIQTAGVEAVGTADSGRTLMLNSPAVGLNSGAPLGGVGMILGSFRGTLTDVQLTTAEQKGDVSILSRPSVTTINNHSASIRSGAKFYVKTSGNVTIGGTTGAAVSTGTNLQQIVTGIELKVTPQISMDEFIKLDIAATESEADFTKAIEGIPAVLDNTATTTVMLKNGETTIIGGLFRVRDAKTIKGIPGLMKIPILGNLFKSKSKTKARSELLIFITPKIIESTLSSLPHYEEPDSMYYTEPILNPERKEKKKRKFRFKY